PSRAAVPPLSLHDALPIYAREGGTEAQDWCEMLMRMYLYYCEQQEWDVSEVHKTYGEEAGIKDVTLYVKGPMAFGYLSAERGTQDRKSTRLNSSHVKISYA